jgi:thymidylate synthase
MKATLISGEGASVTWQKAASRILRNGEEQQSRIGKTREMRHVVLDVHNPIDRVVFSRPINPAFAIAEVIWILAGANRSEFIKFWNPRLVNYLDQNKDYFHGAYGYRIGSSPKLSARAEKSLRVVPNNFSEKFDQLKQAIEILENHPSSRQVVLQIWSSELDFPNPNPRSLDIPCNVFGHLLLRNNKLEWTQMMRSTDLVWGLPYNFIQWTTIQEIVAGWLDVSVGNHVLISNSLHVYEHHWNQLERWSRTKKPSNIGLPLSVKLRSYDEWQFIFSLIVDFALDLVESRTRDEIITVTERGSDFPKGYGEWAYLLGADALRRKGYREEAKEIILKSGRYWSESWLNWEENKYKRKLSGISNNEKK